MEHGQGFEPYDRHILWLLFLSPHLFLSYPFDASIAPWHTATIRHLGFSSSVILSGRFLCLPLCFNPASLAWDLCIEHEHIIPLFTAAVHRLVCIAYFPAFVAFLFPYLLQSLYCFHSPPPPPRRQFVLLYLFSILAGLSHDDFPNRTYIRGPRS